MSAVDDDWESFLTQGAIILSNEKNNLDIPVTTGVGNHWYAIGKYMNLTKSILETI